MEGGRDWLGPWSPPPFQKKKIGCKFLFFYFLFFILVPHLKKCCFGPPIYGFGFVPDDKRKKESDGM
jgi:hypothetical protein